MIALTEPFFEIGPKNLLRRGELAALARSAGKAGLEHGVRVVLTVPTALIAPIRDLDTGVLVFAQGMDLDPMGPTLGRVTAESLVDAGAAGVMLNHDSNPLGAHDLELAVERARLTGLQTVLCAGSPDEALRLARLGPSAVLVEPPALIGTATGRERPWIAATNQAVRQACPGVLLMHAGGVASASTARSIMTQGSDGTGSTSGVLTATDPLLAAQDFIAATRAGWDTAQRSH